MRRSATAAALLLCVACAATPRAEPPPAQGRLAEAQAHAAALIRSGDAAGAARSYEAALRIAASVEDADAIAANAINLSLVYQWLGRLTEARKVLSIVVDDGRRPFSEARRLQAELRQAIVELALGEPAAAAALAARAAKRCGNGCSYAPTLLNVQAEIALATGNAGHAAAQAQAALERARARGDRREAANALRALGRAGLLRNDAAAARPFLEQALEIDRSLADPRKILADLNELSRAAAQSGDAEAARGYGERALAVSRASADGRIPDIEAGLKRP
jgi:tetratricopeptide (TPR) repeat protein